MHGLAVKYVHILSEHFSGYDVRIIGHKTLGDLTAIEQWCTLKGVVMFRVKTFCIRTGESLSDFDQRVNVLVETLDKKPTCIPEDSVGSNGAWVHTLTVIYEPNPEKRKEYADEASTTR